MLVAIITAIFYYFLFTIVGSQFYRLVRQNYENDNINFFTGMILFNGVLNLLHFFLPVNIFMSFSIFLGVLFFPKSTTLIKEIFSRFYGDRILIFILFAIMIISVGRIQIYDTYLYHNQNIKWIQNYPIVFGLANIHGRFGFNSTVFTLYASQQIEFLSPFYIFNGLSAAVLLREIVRQLLNPNRLLSKMGFISFLFAFLFYAKKYYASPSPDLAVFIFSSAALIYFLTSKEEEWNIYYVMLLLAYIPLVKLNMAVWVVVVGLYFLNYTIKNKQYKSLVVPIFLVSIWISSNIVVSGQLVYPLPAVYSNYFKHSVSYTQVIKEKIAVTGWAQSPGNGYQERYEKNGKNFKWIPEWYSTRLNSNFSYFPFFGKITNRFLIIFVLVVLFFYFFRKIIDKDWKFKLNFNGVVLFALWANVIFWFLTGPDMRFGAPIFYMILLYFNLIATGGTAVLLFMFILFTTPAHLYINTRYFLSDIKNNISFFMVPHGMGSGRYGNPDEIIKVQADTIFSANKRENLPYYYPVKGDQCPDDYFPCVPYKVDSVKIAHRGRWLMFSVK